MLICCRARDFWFFSAPGLALTATRFMVLVLRGCLKVVGDCWSIIEDRSAADLGRWTPYRPCIKSEPFLLPPLSLSLALFSWNLPACASLDCRNSSETFGFFRFSSARFRAASYDSSWSAAMPSASNAAVADQRGAPLAPTFPLSSPRRCSISS